MVVEENKFLWLFLLGERRPKEFEEKGGVREASWQAAAGGKAR